jgi:hypothetical protein
MYTFCPSINVCKMGRSVWKSFQSIDMFCLLVYLMNFSLTLDSITASE